MRNGLVRLAAVAYGLIAPLACAGEPLGVLSAPVAAQVDHCLPRDVMAALAPAFGSPYEANDATYPSYLWPFVTPFQSDHSISNYVDRDATTGLRDYDDGAITYDTHKGTDIAILDFRAMDRGVPIRAGGGGTVAYAQYAYPDRSYGPPYTNSGNGITIQQSGGSYTSYWHFRTNSLAVEQGEAISAGQFIGLVGSSGYSTGPHLHFEPGEYVGPTWTPRDPWNGTNNALPSLWASQPPYVGTAPLRVYQVGVTNEDGVGGDAGSPNWTLFKDGVTTPAVFGAAETYLIGWVHVQAPPSTTFTMEIVRPDGSIYGSVPLTLSTYSYAFWYAYWLWNGVVDPSDYGVWTVRVKQNSTIVRSSTFTVGGATQYAPRFSPLAGRSFRISGATQRDTLRVATGAGAVTYSLLNAPAFVTLVDSVVTIAATSTQPARSFFFQARATNAAGTDTMWYHIVDPSKPLDDITSARGVGDGPALAAPELAIRASAARGTVLFTIDGFHGSASIDVFAVDGGRVARLTARERVVRWTPASVPGGVYVVRARSAEGAATARVALVH